MALTTKQRRRLTPSRAVISGAGVGGAIATVLTGIATANGIPVTPELAAAGATLATAAVAWLTHGGRAGEP